MSNKHMRWVLAFDASCGTCGRIAQAVARASETRLEVMPLTHPEVRRWLGSGAAWKPTLIRVQGPDVAAWTGMAMGARILRHLGPRSAMRVVGALGRLRRSGGRVVQFGAGLAVVGSLIMAKTGPAGQSPQAWVEANRDHLPQSYDEVIEHEMPYRRAIFAALPPDVRGRLWVAHLNRYRDERPEISPEQADVIDRAVAFAGRGLVTRQGPSEDATVLHRLGTDAVQAFGHDEARALLATLGPAAATAAAVDCDCANLSDWCGSGTGCTNYPQPCNESSSGCGDFWVWECDGICQPPLT